MNQETLLTPQKEKRKKETGNTISPVFIVLPTPIPPNLTPAFFICSHESQDTPVTLPFLENFYPPISSDCPKLDLEIVLKL